MLSLLNKGFVRAALLTGIMLPTWPVEAGDDFIIVLDQSKSMLEKSSDRPELGYEVDPGRAVKSHGAISAIKHMVSDVLQIDDYLAIITFGNSTKTIISQTIAHKHEREVIQKRIGDLRFLDTKTDIVAGIKSASNLIDSLGTPGRRKILVLVTDGNNDPPKNSPFAQPEQQREVYDSLREYIEQDRWNFTVVGLGKLTNASNILNQLGLPPEAALVLDAQQSDDIKERLSNRIDTLHKALVKLTPEHIRIQLKPYIFGGYPNYEEKMTLYSSFKQPVNIRLFQNDPVKLDIESATAVVSSDLLSLNPDQEKEITITFNFFGQRPQTGEVVGNFEFQFDKGSLQFYPYAGSFKIVFRSWWEAYGLFVLATALGVPVFFAITRSIFRRVRVSELRVLISASDNPLGEPMTLRRKDTVTIGNNVFSGRSVSAQGLSCAIAAVVKYLGRRKFEISAEESTLMQSGKQHNRLIVSLDMPFDLQDQQGKFLRDITISKYDRSTTDPFGMGTVTVDF